VIIDTQSLKVICTAHGIGKEHDFQLFKRSKVKPLSREEEANPLGLLYTIVD
jgi:hypothetical protein